MRVGSRSRTTQLPAALPHPSGVATGWPVARSTGGVHRSAFGVVDQKANEGLVQLAENGVVSCGGAVARLPTSL